MAVCTDQCKAASTQPVARSHPSDAYPQFTCSRTCLRTYNLGSGASAMYFQYDSLPDGDQIRLLRILSASKYGISTTLVTTVLNSAPPYDALSYTWGSPLSPYISKEETVKSYAEESFFMMCNGRRIKIGRNLRDALIVWHNVDKNALPKPKNEYIWADAVCINQDDLDEKAVQVRLMEEIFPKASKVVAWLGPDDETTPYVFEVLSRLSSLRLNQLSSVAPEDMWRPEIHVQKLGIEPLDHRHWLASVAFAHRPYFKRVWIVQESLLARDIIGICGCHIFEWTALTSAWYFLAQTGWATLLYTEQMRFYGKLPPSHQLGVYQKLVESKLDSGMCAWNLITGRATSREKQWTLTSLLMRHRYCSGTNPLDMVYALIGVARKNFKPFDAQPQLLDVSYRISATELYTRTARGIMLAWGHLDHLTLKEGSFMTKIDEPLSQRSASANWSASEGLDWTPTPRSLDSPYLDVQGRFMGLVEDMAMNPVKVETEDDSPALWDSVRKLVSGLQMPYAASFSDTPAILQIESRFEVVWRTLLADCFEQSHPAPPSVADHFIEHIWMLIVNELKAKQQSRSPSIFGRLMNKIPITAAISFRGSNTDELKSFVASAWGVLMAEEPESSDFGIEKFSQAGEKVIAAVSSNQAQNPWFDGMLAWRRENNISFGRRRVFKTDTRLLGLGPIDMQPGDEVWVLAGGSTPFVLRANGTATYRHMVLGSAYVHGIMHGEAVMDFDRNHLQHITLE